MQCWHVGLLAGVLAVAGLALSAAERDVEEPSEVDPLGANAACYVCHTTFVKEPLAKSHLKAKVDCIKCHGLSDKHANDENIGATKPDITFKRGQIDAACEKCHEEHTASVRKVLARFQERKLPPNRPAVCTDCHGMHRIEEEGGRGSAEGGPPSGESGKPQANPAK